MNISTFYNTTICVLAADDKLTDCPEGSYAVIEDSGFYVVLLVMGNDAWTIDLIRFTRLKMRSTSLPGPGHCWCDYLLSVCSGSSSTGSTV